MAGGTADFVAVDEYRFDGDWNGIAAESFWPVGKTLFIRTTAETPPGVPLEGLFLQFDAEGLEGLLTINGRPYAGIDANHLRVSCPEAGTLRLEAEFVCLLAALHGARVRRERARLREGELRADRPCDRGGVLRSLVHLRRPAST